MNDKVRILGIAGSPRAGNTEILVQAGLEGARQVEGVETAFYTFHGKRIGPCQGECYLFCSENGDCCFMDDFEEFFALWLEADGILFGVPVYHMSVPAQVKAAIDRLGQVLAGHLGNDIPRFSKVSAALVQGLDNFGGQELTTQFLIEHFLLMNCVAIAGDLLGSYIGCNAIAPGIELDAISRDERALRIARNAGRRVAEMALIIKAGMEALGPALPPEYRFTWEMLGQRSARGR